MLKKNHLSSHACFITLSVHRSYCWLSIGHFSWLWYLLLHTKARTVFISTRIITFLLHAFFYYGKYPKYNNTKSYPFNNLSVSCPGQMKFIFFTKQIDIMLLCFQPCWKRPTRTELHLSYYLVCINAFFSERCFELIHFPSKLPQAWIWSLLK